MGGFTPTYSVPEADVAPAGHQDHFHQPVGIGPYTIFAYGSGYVGVNENFQPLSANFFLDPESWEYIYAELGLDKGNTTLVDWPDFGVLGVEEFAELIDHIQLSLMHGVDVAVGCIGAHGRTGTLLAGLTAVVEGCDAEEAVRRVRARYCGKAVETKGQVQLIAQVLERAERA